MKTKKVSEKSEKHFLSHTLFTSKNGAKIAEPFYLL